MSFFSRVIRADSSRISRFHTASGDLVLSPDMLPAALSTFLRLSVKQYPRLPWITYPAIRALDDILAGRTLFEYGSGSSTQWYAERCEKVVSVENDQEWFNTIKAKLADHENCEININNNDDEFVEFINRYPFKFDAIVIDAKPFQRLQYKNSDTFRVACLKAALKAASDNCMYIIDNTDANPLLSEEVDRTFPPHTISRFKGWVPGLLHPNETTIVRPYLAT